MILASRLTKNQLVRISFTVNELSNYYAKQCFSKLFFKLILKLCKLRQFLISGGILFQISQMETHISTFRSYLNCPFLESFRRNWSFQAPHDLSFPPLLPWSKPLPIVVRQS